MTKLNSKKYFKLFKFDITLIIFLIVTISLTIKSLLFTVFVGGLYNPSTESFLNAILYPVLLLTLPCLFFKNKSRLIYLIIVNLIFTIILILDTWYFRTNSILLGVRLFLNEGLFNPFNRPFVNFEPMDLLFFIDILILVYFTYKIKLNFKFHKISLINILLLPLILKSILTWTATINTYDIGTTAALCQEAGPIIYHALESYTYLNKSLSNDNNLHESAKNSSSSTPLTKDEWFKIHKENLPPNQYKGLLKGDNVIFIQFESLERFVLSKDVNGAEITPTLNKLLKSSLYFNNIYEQNFGGNSIDCCFMINTSLYPLGDKISLVHYGDKEFTNSFPRILKRDGYYTLSSHAEKGYNFNWAESHKKALGFDKVLDDKEYTGDEKVGYGLSDELTFPQFYNKLTKLPQPFYAVMPTLSSHGPFDLPQKYRTMNLPKELDKNMLGDYFESIRFTDDKLSKFIDTLQSEGKLNDTTIVIYGDHTGVHKYYMDKIKDAPLEGDWWKNQENSIPFIIYSPKLKATTIDKFGGQVDIAPTLLYLLGIDESKYDTMMGRNLLNTNRNATIRPYNTILGTPSSIEEKKLLESAYDVSSEIIKNN